MAEILPIRRKTLSNQSINLCRSVKEKGKRQQTAVQREFVLTRPGVETELVGVMVTLIVNSSSHFLCIPLSRDYRRVVRDGCDMHCP